jgi:multidrug transporter EmrE-like cation transporter
MGDRRMVLLLIFTFILLGVSGQFFLKKGMNNIGSFYIKDILSYRVIELVREKYVVTGLILYVFATLVWLLVLSRAELSYAYPLLSINYVLVLIISKVFFNEEITFLRFFGIILVALGVGLIISRA